MLKIPGGEIYVQVDPNQPLPKQMPQHNQGLRSAVGAVSKVAAGVTALVSWIKSGAEAVPQEVANKHAEICASCPLNDRGDWTRLFTVPAQNAIRAAMSQRREWKLSTPSDDKLAVCSACNCPIPLKVWMPLQAITSKMPQESFNALHEACWIRQSA